MKNIAKNAAVRTRDKVFSRLTKTINDLEHKVASLEQTQSQILDEQRGGLAKIKQLNPPTLQVSDDEVIVKIFSDVKISLSLKDISVTPHLALDGIWERDVTFAWLRALRKSDIVLDIGANFGYFGLLAAQQTHGYGGRTIFFEANPNLIANIQKTLSINNYHEFSQIENVAVSNKKGQVTLNILQDYIGSSSVNSMEHLDEYIGNKMPLKKQSSVKVQAVSIDDYCVDNAIKNLDLIKMDIEGYEDTAYEGMRKAIESSKGVTMFIEFTKNSYKKPEAFYSDMLKDFGRVYTIDSNGDFITPSDNSYDSVLGDTEDWKMLVFSKKELK